MFAGWRVARYARLGSTSDEARRRALIGDPGRLWIVADKQTHGRGRHGRDWRSPQGNLYASALVVDPCRRRSRHSRLRRRRRAGQGRGRSRRADVALKWPNDLLWDGAKLAGLLVEGVAEPGRGLASSSASASISPPRRRGSPIPSPISTPRCNGRFAGRPVPPARGSLSTRRSAYGRAAPASPKSARVGSPPPPGSAARFASRVRAGLARACSKASTPNGRLLMRTAGAIETIEAADLFLDAPVRRRGRRRRRRAPKFSMKASTDER